MIPIYQPSLYGREKEYVNQCLDSTWISSRGEFIERFEASFCDYLGAEYATSVCNGTVALHLALVALGIGPGDEVIVPTFTYVASVNTILQAGATPVFVDCERDTWQISVSDANSKISKRTKAVMAVHLYGHPCDMDAVCRLCVNNELLLIEDCAEAFGSKYKGKFVGTFGDAATFSFFGNKTLTTGEGGMAIFKEASAYKRACHLKSQGVSSEKEYWHDCLAYNYRMTNICAAIGLAQLEAVGAVLRKKREIAEWYKELLSGLPLSCHEEKEGVEHTYWMCSILLDDKDLRDSLRAHLKEHGVDSRPLFPLVNTMPHCRSDGEFANSVYISCRGINLPSYPGLSRGQVELICEAIKSYLIN